MVEFQRYAESSASPTTPTIRFNFDETSQANDYKIVQYFVDFLSGINHDATVISNLQAVIDTNTGS